MSSQHGSKLFWHGFNAIETSHSSNIQCFAYDHKLKAMMVMFRTNPDEVYNYSISSADLLEFLREAVRQDSWGKAWSVAIKGKPPALFSDNEESILKCKAPNLQWLRFMDEIEIAQKFNQKLRHVFDVNAVHDWLCMEQLEWKVPPEVEIFSKNFDPSIQEFSF